jgi:hypothetical protein
MRRWAWRNALASVAVLLVGVNGAAAQPVACPGSHNRYSKLKSATDANLALPALLFITRWCPWA